MSLIRAGGRSFALIAALLAAGSALADAITVRDAYAISANPRTGAAFMVIENAGSADRIVAASAPVAPRVELHTHVMENGVAKMVAIEAIELPAAGTVTLERGGLHVMFMGMTAPLEVGQTFPLTLTLGSGGTLTVDVTVRPLR